MNNHRRRLLALISLGFLLSTACGISRSVAPVDPSWPSTAAARTWSAMQTSSYLTASPTFTPLPATDTPFPTDTPQATLTPTPTQTLIPVLTQLPTHTPTVIPTITRIPTVTRIPGGGGGGGSGGGGGGGSQPPCYAAELVRDVTIPNNQVLNPSTTFTKIWRVKNVGGCIWPSGSRMVPVTDNLWSGDAANHDGKVKPGQSVDYTVNLTSPTSNGQFTGDWQLRVDKNTRLNPRNADHFRVRITVSQNPVGSLYNFVEYYCTARWRTDADRTVKCPSGPSDRNVFVRKASPATLEGGDVKSAVIRSQPASNKNASIIGAFPAMYIYGDEHFTASVGCLQGFDDCKVQVQVSYRVLGGDEVPISSIQEEHDGVWHVLVNDFPLTFPAGTYVSFIFRVTTLNGKEPAAAWFNVELYR